MVSSDSDIFGVKPGRITIGSGATLAQFVDVVAGEKALLLKYVSGGTLEILEAVSGTTLSLAALAAANGTGYVMTAGEVLSLDGPCRLYLSSTGATTIVHTIRGKGAGN